MASATATARVVIPPTGAALGKDARTKLAEGSFWDHASGSLLWIDILGQRIFVASTSPLTASNVEAKSDTAAPDAKAPWYLGSIDTEALKLGFVGTVVATKAGHLVAGVQTGVVLLELPKPLYRTGPQQTAPMSQPISAQDFTGTCIHYDIAVRHVHVLASPERDLPGQRSNDGKCDPSGRLWVGTMAIADKDRGRSGSLYRVDVCASSGSADAGSSVQFAKLPRDTDGRCVRQLSHITISNGVIWSADRKTMYYVDSPDQTVYSFAFDDAKGSIHVTPSSNVGSAWDRDAHRLFRTPTELGEPDGITIDSEGRLWIAHWGGHCVAVWSVTEAGGPKCIASIPLPVSCVSSVAFGGSDLSSLYVTSASVASDVSKEPLAGAVFVIENVCVNDKPVRGVVASVFDDSLLFP